MFDLAVVGSGFGGSLLALIARRLGRSVVLLEKGVHPRFVIGESSTPLADLLWLELSSRYDLPELAPFAKWGTWRHAHPEVACGLKRGFTFLHHCPGASFKPVPDRGNQLMVAASPRDDIADTHWYRPDFDHFLVLEAMRQGTEFHDQCEVTGVTVEPGGSVIETRHVGCSRTFHARFVVDGSNHRGPLARSLNLEDRALPRLPATEALYTHFRGVTRLDAMQVEPDLGAAPYPIDDAAVHHVFDGGWIWVLRFVNGITSAGVAAVSPVARRLRFEEGAIAWDRLLRELPTVAEQFRGGEAVRPFVHSARIGFQTGPAAGPGWALLPSAAGFVDPLLSSGFTLTLLGIGRLAEAIERHWDNEPAFRLALEQHARTTEGELLALEQYVAAFYARMGDFAAFTEIARLYFCAVIYCETARRLGRPGVAGGFLMRDHPDFGSAAADCCEAARRGAPASELRERVERLLSRFDLGGLADPVRRPWYPVRADDLRACRGRIGASAVEIEALLRKAGMVEPALEATPTRVPPGRI